MRALPILSTIQRASPRKRLWLGGGALGLFLLTIVVSNGFIASDRAVTRRMLGHDFLAFYTAGTFVREGRARELYNLDAVRDCERATAAAADLEVGPSFGPWWNPPFYALLFAPLARLPYGPALDAWRWINVGAVAVAAGLLAVMVARAGPTRGVASWGLVPLLVLVSMPCLQAFSHGQNTPTSLLLLTVTVSLWRAERRVWAGLVAGFLFYKPQLAAVVATAMVLDLGPAALAGLATTGLALLALTCLALPGSLGDWTRGLPAILRWMQVDHAYLWERHVTIKAFWRLLLQGREAGAATWVTTVLTDVSLLSVGAPLGISVLRGRQRTATDDAADRGVRRDRLISAVVLAMPLLMPFYFDYDLLLLAVPATLYAAERLGRPDFSQPQDRRLTAAWTVLFLWLFVNPGLARETHVGGTVLLLLCVTGLSIRRVSRPERDHAPIILPHPRRIPMAA